MSDTDLDRIISAYERFVPREFLRLLGKEDITRLRLGDHVEKSMTFLFADIRNFTSLSESITPQECFFFLNSYLSRMEPVILAHHGVIDKFIGDAIMALFPTSADDALACAITMLNQLPFYNDGRQRAGYREIRIGIGLNTGLAILGTIGGAGRMEGTVISDAVNLASRLEKVNKTYGTQLLIGEHTLYSLRDPARYHIRFLDRIAVSGKEMPQSVYEVFDADPPALRTGKEKTRRLFVEALAHYHYQHIPVAMKLLHRCLDSNPEDRSAWVYLERCRRFLATGVHESTGELSCNLVWSEKYQIGVPEIDAQHQELFRRASQFLHAVSDDERQQEATALLEFLNSFVVTHFDAEERLMKEQGYPFYQAQKSQHEKLKKYFARIRQELRQTSREDRFYTMFRFQLLVADWLINHTLREDRHLGKFLREKEAAPAEPLHDDGNDSR